MKTTLSYLHLPDPAPNCEHVGVQNLNIFPAKPGMGLEENSRQPVFLGSSGISNTGLRGSIFLNMEGTNDVRSGNN